MVMGSGAPLRRNRAKRSEPSSITGPKKLQTLLQVAFPDGPIFTDLQLLSLFDQAIFSVFCDYENCGLRDTGREYPRVVQNFVAKKVIINRD